jgi:hypothetical protein
MGRNCARARDKSLSTILTKSRRGLGVMTASIIIKPLTSTGGLILAGMGKSRIRWPAVPPFVYKSCAGRIIDCYAAAHPSECR